MCGFIVLLENQVNTLKNITSKPSAAVASEMRDRIYAARFISVMLMIYVHVPGTQLISDASGIAAGIRLDHWLESLLIEGPGRASAALLSVISGYLAAITLVRSGGWSTTLYKRRFSSLIIPMCSWAFITWVVYMILGRHDSIHMTEGSSLLDRLNVIFFITETPYGPTMHLGFLRDLFVCVLLSPLLLLLLRRFPVFILAALSLYYLSGYVSPVAIILRPLVILCFALGMLFAIRHTALDKLDNYWWVFLFLTGVFAVLIIWTNAGLLAPLESYFASFGLSLKETLLYPVCRIFGSLAIWCALPLCLGSRLNRWIKRFTPFLFVTFCSHFLVMSIIFYAAWLPLAGDRDSPVYLVWFLSAPFIALACAATMVYVLNRFLPPLARLISGGRLSSSKPEAKSDGKLATSG